MACPALAPEITSDRHLTSILTDAHLDTRFHVQDANDVAVTLKGTRPGDSLADLLFSILLSPVLAELQELEASLGLAFRLSLRVSTHCLPRRGILRRLCIEITFADDTAFLGVLPAVLPPAQMLSLVHDWALGIHNIFVKRALIPNYDVVKSSLLLAGKNSTHYKKALAACDQEGPDRACVVPSQTSRHEQASAINDCFKMFHGCRIHIQKGKHVAALSPLRRAVFRKGFHS